jgi:glycosyltransferase involved in cell wall biosynthesis
VKLTARHSKPQAGVIALVPDAWDSVWTTRHQILTRLAKYFDVVWIDSADYWREYWSPYGTHVLQRGSFRELSPCLTVMAPGAFLPRFHRPAWLRRTILRRTLRKAHSYLKDRGSKRVMLYLWRYQFAEALDLIQHDASCYHVDDEYSFSDVDVPPDPIETRLLGAVDQVIVHSSRLLARKGGLNRRTAMIPNGVDYRTFSAGREEPSDLAPVSRPRIGYLGVIKKQLDLALLNRLAHRRPDWSFVLVGPIGHVSGKEHLLAALQALPNVCFLGSKPVHELAAYMQHMDVCLMCYEVTDYTNSIYPLKLHEYLSSGRPTVAAPITSVAEHADVVSLARTDEEWLAAITDALGAEATSAAEVERRRERARNFDWDRLADQVAGLFREHLNLK